MNGGSGVSIGGLRILRVSKKHKKKHVLDVASLWDLLENGGVSHKIFGLESHKFCWIFAKNMCGKSKQHIVSNGGE